MDGNVFLLNGSHDYNDDPDEQSHKNMNKKEMSHKTGSAFSPLKTGSPSMPEKCVTFLMSVETGKYH